MSVVNTNMMSLNAQRHLSKTSGQLGSAMERLASGMRVNSAKDDAAGLSIATSMTAQIRGMTVATRNANDGISFAQVAEGAIGQMQDTLQRMRDLAVQSANGANSPSDRANLNTEFTQLSTELARVVVNTNFNGKPILNGSGTTLNFQVGANTAADNQIKISIASLTTLSGVKSLATSTAASLAGVSRISTALSSVKAIDDALRSLSDVRATLGAAQNRFSMTITNLQSTIENQSAARSRIMDTDFATETANLSRAQILQQAGTAMLSQANQAPQSVLSLLR